MKRPNIKHSYRIIAWAVVFILVMVVSVHLMLPFVINLQGLHQMIRKQAAEALSADVDFRLIEPALLPSPRVTVNRLSISAPEKVTANVHQVMISFNIWSLITGKIEVDRVKLIEPDVLILQPLQGAGSFPPLSGLSLETLQKNASDLLTSVAGVLGQTQFLYLGGRIRVQHADGINNLVPKLDGRLQMVNGQIDIGLRGYAAPTRQLYLEGLIEPRTLDSSVNLSIDGLHTREIKALGIDAIGDQLPDTVVNVGIFFKSKALKIFEIDFGVHTPELHLANPSSKGRLTIEELMIEGHVQWTPELTRVTRIKLSTASPFLQMAGSFRWSHSTEKNTPPIQIAFNGHHINLSQIRDSLMQLYGDHPVIRNVLNIVRGGVVPSLAGQMSASHWSGKALMERFKVELDLVDGRIMVPPNDLLDLENVSGHVVISDGRLKAYQAAARLGRTSAKNGELVLGLYDRSRAFSLDTLIDADLAALPAVLRKLIKSEHHLAQLEQMPRLTGRASGRLMLGDRLDRITADITATARIETADSAIDLMGSITDLPGTDTAAKVFVKGQIGAGVLDWLWRVSETPPEYLLNTPFTIGGANITWDSSDTFTLIGDLKRDNGLRAAAALTAQKDEFHLERLHIRSGKTDALVSFKRQVGRDVVEIGFQGHVDRFAVDSLFRQNPYLDGWINGDFNAIVDHGAPERTVVDGQGAVRNLDIPLKDAMPVRVVTASVNGLKNRFVIPSMSLQIKDQNLWLSGGGQFLQHGLDLDMAVHADTLSAKKLTPVITALKGDDQPRSSGANARMSIQGKFDVNIDQLDYHRYRIAPFKAIIDQRGKQTTVHISTADVCGIQLPGRVHWSDGIATMELQPRVIGTGLKAAGSCLLDVQHTERLDGTVDLSGQITTNGKTNAELVTNLKGTVNLHIGKGRIYNVGSAGLFTNLLSFLSIGQYATGDLPDLSKNDFHYNRIDSRLEFRGGLIYIKEGVVKSNSVNMVADGKYNISGRVLDLKMLVSPLTTVDWIIERIPIIGNILGGTLVAIPVRVKGHQSDPQITPLALSAVGSRLGGILERTVKTPVRIIEPLLKNEPEKR